MTDRPDVKVVIGTLSLQGIAVPNRERLGPAVARELATLISENAGEGSWRPTRVESMTAAPITVRRSHPDALARAVARSVYQRMRP